MRAYLISSTGLRDGVGRFLQDRALVWEEEQQGTDPERAVEIAGRICYMSFGDMQHRRNNKEYVRNLIVMGHESVLEHANFTVLADGISRALTHQLVRHRIGFSYSQLSQQYHDESAAEFICPTSLNEHADLRNEWNALMEKTRALYKKLLNVAIAESGTAPLNAKEKTRLRRSVARTVLPNATATTLVTTGNARAWRHLFRVRGALGGDLEMRNYCVAVFELLSREAPHLFDDFKLSEDALGQFVLGSE